MKNELENILYDKYKNFFSLKDNTNEPISYGIECGDGWFEILSSLCFMIAQHEKNIEGNNKYLSSKNEQLIEYEPFRFTQIKEKFGGLRVYCYGGDEYIRGLIGMAECWSYKTCEICGEKGISQKNGWIMVLCQKCNAKLDNK